MTLRTDTLTLQGLNCASCAARAEQALSRLKGVTDAHVNLATTKATVTHTPSVSVSELSSAVSDAGYPPVQEDQIVAVEGMNCASCVGRVERAANEVEGVVSAAANLANGTLHVTSLAGMVPPASLLDALKGAGYEGRVRDTGDQGQTAAQDNAADIATLRRQVIIAALLAAPVFLIEMGGHLIPPLHHWIAATLGQTNSHLLQMVLTACVLAGPGRVFFEKGVPSLLRRAPDMNALVAVGTSAAFLFSVCATLAPGLFPSGTAHVYFESAAVIVVLVLFGRMLEARSKGQAGAAIARLMELGPKDAVRIEDGVPRLVPVSSLRAGDILRIRPGERIAADGDVVRGTSFVDESTISGEPVPVEKQAGSQMFAGTVNGSGSLDMRATRAGSDTVLAGIVRMVEDAQGSKLPIQALVDRVTLWFVPAVFAVATLTFAVWYLLGPEPAISKALVTSVSVLIIACPCAMGLATPTSIMVGTGRAAEQGILFRRGEALQTLSDIRMVIFDKTGTLTEGHPKLTTIHVAKGFDQAAVLDLAASVEAHSEHPIAQAIVAAANGPPSVADDVAVRAGLGVSAKIGDQVITLGNQRLMVQEGINLDTFASVAKSVAENAETPVWVAIDGQVAALIGVSDPLKASAPSTVSALRAAGLDVAMITGDAETNARVIAARAGITHVVAECLPADKVTSLARFQEHHGPIAFVGDGINDAPALASADVGLSIGGGTDIAVEAADVVLMSEDPMRVAHAIRASRQVLRNIRQNLFWAFAYNACLIPVAAGLLYVLGGPLLSPALAAGAMALSSVLVVSNALRLRRMRFESAVPEDPQTRTRPLQVEERAA